MRSKSLSESLAVCKKRMAHPTRPSEPILNLGYRYKYEYRKFQNEWWWVILDYRRHFKRPSRGERGDFKSAGPLMQTNVYLTNKEFEEYFDPFDSKIHK